MKHIMPCERFWSRLNECSLAEGRELMLDALAVNERFQHKFIKITA